jgi:hypothetical protein
VVDRPHPQLLPHQQQQLLLHLLGDPCQLQLLLQMAAPLLRQVW